MRLLKVTTKSIYFLPAKKKIPILWIEPQANKIQKVSKPLFKHQAVKNLQIAKTFLENVNKEVNIIFHKISYFLLQSSFLSIYLHRSIHKK